VPQIMSLDMVKRSDLNLIHTSIARSFTCIVSKSALKFMLDSPDIKKFAYISRILITQCGRFYILMLILETQA